MALRLINRLPKKRGWSGGAKVLGKLSVPGRPTSLDDSRARAYCSCSRCGWGLFGHFFPHLSILFSSPSLWETARYRLKYCLKGPLNPKQPTNQHPKKRSLSSITIINNHIFHNATRFSVSVNEDQERLPTFYWLPKLHKKTYKARFIANSSSCTTTELSKLLTSCLTTIKNHVIKYCEKVYERSGENLFWSIKHSCEVLNKLKSLGFRASSLSTYDFSTLYTTLPHNLIKDNLVDLIERTFQREGSLYIACNDRNAFFTSDAVRNYNLWSCQKVCEALTFLLDNIYIRFGSKLYRQIVGIPMGTNCAPLVADLFLFCYERDFMLSLSEDNQSGVIEAFNSTSRYLDDLLNIDNNFFDSMVNRIYPSELQLNKANVSDAEASFLDLHLSISDGFVKTKIYDKRDDFDFDIVNFPFLDGGGRVLRRCWVNFQGRGVLLIWIIIGQGPTALAVGAGGRCLDIFTLIYPFFPLPLSLWETARYRLKYCLKGPLNPKPTNQPTFF